MINNMLYRRSRNGRSPSQSVQVPQPSHISLDLALPGPPPSLVQVRPILTNPDLSSEHLWCLFRMWRILLDLAQSPQPYG